VCVGGRQQGGRHLHRDQARDGQSPVLKTKPGQDCPGGVFYIVVSCPPAKKEIGAMGCEIQSRQGRGWYLFKKKKAKWQKRRKDRVNEKRKDRGNLKRNDTYNRKEKRYIWSEKKKKARSRCTSWLLCQHFLFIWPCSKNAILSVRCLKLKLGLFKMSFIYPQN
jgi:hypothetical protein